MPVFVVTMEIYGKKEFLDTAKLNSAWKGRGVTKRCGIH
jgi:hypothetical protein